MVDPLRCTLGVRTSDVPVPSVSPRRPVDVTGVLWTPEVTFPGRLHGGADDYRRRRVGWGGAGREGEGKGRLGPGSSDSQGNQG